MKRLIAYRVSATREIAGVTRSYRFVASWYNLARLRRILREQGAVVTSTKPLYR